MNDQPTAQTWRDLPLAAGQALRMERLESTWIERGVFHPGDSTGEEILLDIARERIASAEAADRFAHVPIPPGNPKVDDWEPQFGGGWARQLLWAAFGSDDDTRVEVEVAGEQEPNGKFTRSIVIWGLVDSEEPRLCATAARRLAKHLLAAADVMDQSYYDGLNLAHNPASPDGIEARSRSHTWVRINSTGTEYLCSVPDCTATPSFMTEVEIAGQGPCNFTSCDEHLYVMGGVTFD
jgi:hypothetical protein